MSQFQLERMRRLFSSLQRSLTTFNLLSVPNAHSHQLPAPIFVTTFREVSRRLSRW